MRIVHVVNIDSCLNNVSQNDAWCFSIRPAEAIETEHNSVCLCTTTKEDIDRKRARDIYIFGEKSEEHCSFAAWKMVRLQKETCRAHCVFLLSFLFIAHNGKEEKLRGKWHDAFVSFYSRLFAGWTFALDTMPTACFVRLMSMWLAKTFIASVAVDIRHTNFPRFSPSPFQFFPLWSDLGDFHVSHFTRDRKKRSQIETNWTNFWDE